MGVVGRNAEINQALFPRRNAVGGAATGMPECTAGTSIGTVGALVVSAVLAPLAHVVVGHASVAGAVDDNAVIAVAVCDVDVTPRSRNRPDVGIDRHIRR